MESGNQDLDTPLNTSSVYQNFAELEQDPNKNPRTPISQYNYFVRVYNVECNLVENQRLQEVEDNRFVEALYPFKTKLIFILRLAIPAGLQAFLAILCFGSSSLIWILLSGLVFLCSFLFSGYMAIMISSALEVSTKNYTLVPNPLSQMIYSPVLCKKKKMNTALYEVIERELYATGLGGQEIDILKRRLNDGKVEFMVYNDHLLRWSQALERGAVLGKMSMETGINFFINFSLFVVTCVAYIVNS